MLCNLCDQWARLLMTIDLRLVCSDAAVWADSADDIDGRAAREMPATGCKTLAATYLSDPSREAEPLGEEAVEAVEVDLGTKIKLRINTTVVRVRVRVVSSRADAADDDVPGPSGRGALAAARSPHPPTPRRKVIWSYIARCQKGKHLTS